VAFKRSRDRAISWSFRALSPCQRKTIFANYLRELLRVDFFHTQGELSTAMLGEAVLFKFESANLKVARPEDLIGLKLQALANNPSRSRDRIDIDSMVRQFKGSMNMVLVRQYFVLFEREDELDEILGSDTRSGR